MYVNLPMYALGVVPLINALSDDFINQIWYADDVSACGRLIDAHRWWDRLVSIGPDFGYYPNPSKTCLIVKNSCYDFAVSIFRDSGVCISVEGKRHLGADLGSPSFVASFVTQKFHYESRNSPFYQISQLLNLMQPMLLLFMELSVNGIIWFNVFLTYVTFYFP